MEVWLEASKNYTLTGTAIMYIFMVAADTIIVPIVKEMKL